MSLQVWLPLNQDLRNNGLTNATITNSGATINDNGKFGKCYSFDGTNDKIQISNAPTPSDVSVAMWFKRNATTNTRQFLYTQWQGITLELDTANKVTCSVYSNGSQCGYCRSDDTITVDSGWVHICFVFKNGTGTKLYINGSQISYATLSTPITWNSTTGNIGYFSTYLNACVNDFRIYDHALSLKEVKEISKGLVLHYPLDRGGLEASNLIKNGFGELGSENWSSSTNVSTTDIPSDQSDIKASFSNGMILKHIKIYPTHIYKFSAWIKATTTSGNVYPSLYPYDVDKKFIANYNCPEGFNQNTMTTLTQQLKSGDTKIYVNDLSNWNANSGHYYNWVAIFSYTDSTGYTYPDGQYTQNCAKFGSGTNAKTNLDKTNNIITLTTAYTGRTMPVGTKVCASTEGATYYYPLGGLNLANIQDWTYKENTFSGGLSRLKYAKTVVFCTNYNNRMAGIKFEDITANELTGTIEYDCSGFENNGTRVGTFSWTENTPRYNTSTVFNGVDNAIQTPSLPTMITDKNYTISVWTYKDSIGSKSYQTIYGGQSGFELEARNSGGTSPQYVGWNWGKPVANYEFSKWNHFCFVHSDADCKLYVNGEYISSGTAKDSNPAGNYFIGAWKTSGQQNYEGLMSDFRIYATALSADDVKSLYQVTASADKNNNYYSYSYDELTQGREIEHLFDTQTPSGSGTFTQDKDGLHLNQYIWVNHDYIPINPTGKTYKYDITYSCDAGNYFYIGWERYDANKTSRSNNACVYVVATKPSTDVVKNRVKGTVSLSTDGVNPCAFIKLRILNKWTGSDSNTQGKATIYSLSLKEYSTNDVLTPLKNTKQGIVNTTEILEKDIGVSINDTYELNSNGFYEI